MEAIPGRLPAKERLLLPGLGRKAPVIAQLGGGARHLLIQLGLEALHELGLQGGQCLGIDVPGWCGGLCGGTFGTSAFRGSLGRCSLLGLPSFPGRRASGLGGGLGRSGSLAGTGTTAGGFLLRGGRGVRVLVLQLWGPGACLRALPGRWRGRGQDLSPLGAVARPASGRAPAGSL